jgi:hypothetical protein
VLQAFNNNLFGNFVGYPNGFDDVLQSFPDGRAIMKTPQVVRTVREFFNCSRLQGAELEDDGGRSTSNSHWEMRLFEV